MKAPTSNTQSYEPAPEGNQIGILIGLYNLGPQDYTYQGETKKRHEVRVVFELPNAKAKFGESNEERPYTIGKSGAFSMNEKAFLRKVVEACHGKKLADDEAENFPIESVVGKACLVNVGHFDVQGVKRAKIENVSPLPAGMEAPKVTNQQIVFDVTNYRQHEYDNLPAWLKEKVDVSGFKPKHDDARIPESDKDIRAEDIPF